MNSIFSSYCCLDNLISDKSLQNVANSLAYRKIVLGNLEINTCGQLQSSTLDSRIPCAQILGTEVFRPIAPMAAI